MYELNSYSYKTVTAVKLTYVPNIHELESV